MKQEIEIRHLSQNIILKWESETELWFKVKAKGGGRSEFGVSVQRKKIMSKRAKRQAEDAANAARDELNKNRSSRKIDSQ